MRVTSRCCRDCLRTCVPWRPACASKPRASTTSPGRRCNPARRISLELPGFLGLAAIVSTTDLVATVPRHIGETLASSSSGASALNVWDCPVPVPPFTVKQHWHARYHQDPANRWLRVLCEELFATKPSKKQDQGTRLKGPRDRH